MSTTTTWSGAGGQGTRGQRDHDPDQGRGLSRLGRRPPQWDVPARRGAGCATSTSSTRRRRTSSTTRRPATERRFEQRPAPPAGQRDVSGHRPGDRRRHLSPMAAIVSSSAATSWSVRRPATRTTARAATRSCVRAEHTLIASASDKRTGRIYAWDQANAGGRVRQRRAPSSSTARGRRPGSATSGDVRGPRGQSGRPSTLVWATKNAVIGRPRGRRGSDGRPLRLPGGVRLARAIGRLARGVEGRPAMTRRHAGRPFAART
jgi:hypothetical protein